MNPQSSIMNALTSQVGRKILTGVTGVLLVLFTIGHLSGNLALLSSDPAPFNTYAATLHSFGTLLYVVEVLLAVVILLHAFIGISIAVRRRAARRNGYQMRKTKGGPSRQSAASRSMAITGIVVLIFLVIHLIQFRFGPSITEGYTAIVHSTPERDLYRLVMEVFQNPLWVIFYVGVMILFAFHLRHGIWSALQSLGAMKPRWSNAIYSLALLLALLLAIGFIILPIWIYFNGPTGATV